MEHKYEKSKDHATTSTESRGVLGSVWSAAGALAETVQHAVQGTVSAAEPVATVAGYVASKVVDKASAVLPAKPVHTETTTPTVEAKPDPFDTFLPSPTNDYVEAVKDEPVQEEPKISQEPSITQEIAGDIASRTSAAIDSAKQVVGEVISGVTATASGAIESAKQTLADTTTAALNSDTLLAAQNQIAQLDINKAMEAVKEVGSQAVSGPQLISDAIKQEGDFKLELTMDVVAHLQRIADRTGDQILHETARKAHSACAKGLSEAPGVHLVRITPEQATELVNLAIMTQDHELADFARYCQSVAATTQIGIEPSPGKIQEELAKGRQELSQQGRVHTGPGYGAAFASVGRSAPAQANTATSAPAQATQSAQSAPAPSATPAAPSSGAQLTMDMVAHLQRIADRTGDQVLHDTARKAHSACAKGLSEAPGVHLVSITPDQASELVNLAIRTQDHELANFARYCQSVAATTQLGIEPSPGKIVEEISKGRQELQQQGRAHTGPGYGAAFASISRSNSAQNLSRSNSSQSLGRQSRSSSPTNVPIAPAQPQQEATPTQSQSQPNLQLTMDVVAHLQRIADRTGDTLLHDTARRAHSACAKSLNEAPGVHLTWITPEQATELVNLAIRTQDHELADFARYCQSVAATTQIGVEPSPGKIREEIEKGRQELQQQGRAHTGPGYGAAFASKQNIKTEPQIKIEQPDQPAQTSLVGQPSQ
eukprot:Phypoly_transcript_03807.p1 GENE.Phypoly_transcript_03807~~Phypoly_transcript_03807.p1  ORF type:complete len:714 (+),score=138.72 Phypoly_transcript_03807:122-2263(+)